MQIDKSYFSLFRKTLAVLMMSALVFVWNGQSAYAADPHAAEPAETLDYYVVDEGEAAAQEDVGPQPAGALEKPMAAENVDIDTGDTETGDTEIGDTDTNDSKSRWIMTILSFLFLGVGLFVAKKYTRR